MKKLLLLLFFSTSFAIIVIAPDTPTESDFPGAYISLGLQFGQDNNAIKFRSYQINLGTSIGNPLLVGITFGKRYYNNRSYNYLDFQGNIMFIFGAGIGIVNQNKEIYIRKKIFGGLGPIMYSKDWLNYKDIIENNSGLMLAFPVFTVFGNTLHP